MNIIKKFFIENKNVNRKLEKSGRGNSVAAHVMKWKFNTPIIYLLES
jgi:hypothetical protein